MIIAYFNLPETTVFDVPQSFAGAVRQIEVPAGRYPVEVRRSRFAGHGLYVAIEMAGTQIRNDWFGSNTRIDRERKPATHTAQPYLYEVRNCAESGKAWWGGTFEWAEGVEVRERALTIQGEPHIAKDVYVNGERIETT